MYLSCLPAAVTLLSFASPGMSDLRVESNASLVAMRGVAESW